MARFSEQFIHQVTQATDIVDLVSQYVSLKQRGKEFLGLCPFHDDHKPSMYVVPAKQMFHCFVCKAGGGVFQWMMQYEKVTFPEAVAMLAEKASISLPTDAGAPSSDGPSRNSLKAITDLAVEFFRSQLFSPVGAAALAYARKRGLTDESIAKFALGYAPDSWDALCNAARAKGYGDGLLVAAGLAAPRDGGGCYDRFRNRLIFPIYDPTGQAIAFGGRALDESERAKYLNSPETALFDKSSNLYALNFSREAVNSSGQVVVVEGYLDAIMPLQEGVANVVATLGTALTDRHVRLLRRYASEAVLMLDADAAGAAAAERALEVFLAQQLHVRVATVQAGKDPCDFVLAEGADAFRQVVADAPDAINYVWRQRMEAYESAGGNLADRGRLVEDFLQLVVSSASYGAIDEVRRGQLAQHIGHMLNISPSGLQQQMRRLARRRTRSSAQPRQTAAPGVAEASDPQTPAEAQVLEVLLNRPELFDVAAERIDGHLFTTESLRAIAACVWRLGAAGRLALEDVLGEPALAELGSMVAQLVAEGRRRGNFEQTLDDAVADILYRQHRRDLQQIKSNGYTDDALRRLDQHLRCPDARRHPTID